MAAKTTDTLGKYEIIEEIGRGGFAAVYKAVDSELDREVALKLLAPHLLWDPTFIERFRREAKAMANLNHPNIATLYDYGEQEGSYFLVMEYVSGGTVRELVEREGPLPLEQVVPILEQVAAGLDYAHGRDVIHRDVKSSNVLLTPGGTAKLTDFGLVKVVAETSTLSSLGQSAGTPEYMAPEQFEGQEVGVHTDLYSLGVVLYEMCTGALPFTGPTPLAVMRGVVDKPPPDPREVNPSLPPSVAQVLLRALEKNAVDRYSSAGELTAALAEAVEGERERVRREEQLAVLRRQAEEALAAGEWELLMSLANGVEALAPGDAEALGWRRLAERALAEADAAAVKEHQLANLRAEVESAAVSSEWGRLIKLCRQIDELVPGDAQAEQWLARAQRAQAEAEAVRDRATGDTPAKPSVGERIEPLLSIPPQEQPPSAVGTAPSRSPSRLRWLPVAAIAATAILIPSLIWGIRACSVQPTHVVIERIVKETVIVEVEKPVQVTPVPEPALAASTGTPTRHPTNTPEEEPYPRPSPSPSRTTTRVPTSTPTRVPTQTPTRSATRTATASPSMTVPPAPDAIVVSESVNLRSGPGIFYDVLAAYADGTNVDIIGREDRAEWLSVEMPDGNTGWMSRSVLKLNVLVNNLRVVETPPLPDGINVRAYRDWQYTGLWVAEGAEVRIQYVSGEWSPWSGGAVDAGGYPDMTEGENVLIGHPHAGLIARVGSGATFFVGMQSIFITEDSGSLLFRINDARVDDNSGSIVVVVYGDGLSDDGRTPGDVEDRADEAPAAADTPALGDWLDQNGAAQFAELDYYSTPKGSVGFSWRWTGSPHPAGVAVNVTICKSDKSFDTASLEDCQSFGASDPESDGTWRSYVDGRGCGLGPERGLLMSVPCGSSAWFKWRIEVRSIDPPALLFSSEPVMFESYGRE